jgi:PUA domain protein
VLKLPERCTLYVLPPTKEHPHSEPLFWQHMDDALVPHLRLVHRYPDCWKRVRVDRGAIRFVLSGAALMVPGLTSPGGRLPGDEDGGEEGERWTKQEDMQEGDVVVVEAEGKETACCVGVLQMSSAAMKEAKKGIALGDGHYLGDGLWKMNLD